MGSPENAGSATKTTPVLEHSFPLYAGIGGEFESFGENKPHDNPNDHVDTLRGTAHAGASWRIGLTPLSVGRLDTFVEVGSQYRRHFVDGEDRNAVSGLAGVGFVMKEYRHSTPFAVLKFVVMPERDITTGNNLLWLRSEMLLGGVVGTFIDAQLVGPYAKPAASGLNTGKSAGAVDAMVFGLAIGYSL